MSVRVSWLEGTGRQIIHFQQQETWTWDEYNKAVDEIVAMIESASHYVTVLVDLTGAVTKTRSKEAYQHFTDALDRWHTLSNYAQFFMVLNPSYWSRITLFLIEKVTRTPMMMAVVSVEDAKEKGLARIEKFTAENLGNNELPDTI